MKSGGRNYFVTAFAVVFHLAVIVGIFHASWTHVPSVDAASVNLVGSMQQPRAVQTISFKAAPASASDSKEHPGLAGSACLCAEDKPLGHQRWPVIREWK
jgi:hypothetical protein